MSTPTSCPHCTAPVPPEFASMPICSICGGDLKAAPSSPVWSAVDIRTDNTRTCKKCGESIKSVLALNCPNCGDDVPPPGQNVDAEQEKAKFEAAVTASNTAAPTPKVEEPKPQPKIEPVKVVETPKVKEAQPQVKKEPVVEKPVVKEGFFAKLLRMLGLKK